MARTGRLGVVVSIVLGSLLPQVFAQDSQYNMFYGENMQSEYSVTKKEDGQQVMGAQVFNPNGTPRAQPGRLVAGQVVRMGSDTTRLPSRGFQMNTDGRVWTPRIKDFGGFDLSSQANLTDQPGFDLNAFEKHPAVIRFANGYAINLFAAKVKSHKILSSGDRGTYRTDDGKPLHARLIARSGKDNVVIQPGDKVIVVSSASLMVAKKKLTDASVGTEFEAIRVQGPWVGVKIEHGAEMVYGWVNKEHLAVPGREFVETILN